MVVAWWAGREGVFMLLDMVWHASPDGFNNEELNPHPPSSTTHPSTPTMSGDLEGGGEVPSG